MHIICVVLLPETPDQNLIMKKQTNSEYGIYLRTNVSTFHKIKRGRQWTSQSRLGETNETYQPNAMHECLNLSLGGCGGDGEAVKNLGTNEEI